MNTWMLLGTAAAILLALPFAWALLAAPGAVAIVLGGAVGILLMGVAAANHFGLIRFRGLADSEPDRRDP